MNSKDTITARQQLRAYITLVFLTMVFFSSGLYAQEKKLVTGTVYDNTGISLPGVTVTETGGNSTITDDTGTFSIETSTGGTISFSFIGFTTQTIAVDASTGIVDIKLEQNAIELEQVELVAVGYGTMRKSDLTGAISTVNENNLVKGVVPSTELVLQGKVAGLTVVRGTGDPSSGGSLRLRGGTSLTANNNPLIVVDGIAGVDINIIQPSDIKSIDVLKDAASTAIYGARGANGVVIITTKGGKNTNGRTSVNYNNSIGIWIGI